MRSAILVGAIMISNTIDLDMKINLSEDMVTFYAVVLSIFVIMDFCDFIDERFNPDRK